MYGQARLINVLDLMAYVEDDEINPALASHQSDDQTIYVPIVMVRLRDDGKVQWVYGPSVGTEMLAKSSTYNPVTESHWMDPNGCGSVARWNDGRL